MKRLKLILVLVCMGTYYCADAQVKVDSLKLPDGKLVGADKLDSVKKAWAPDLVRFTHTKEEEQRRIMRLVRQTPEMKKQAEEEARKYEQDMNNMKEKEAKSFSFADSKGNQSTLSALKGKVVVLSFWFTTCPPCIEEMPQLNSLVARYDPKQVVFLAPTFSTSAEVKSFLKMHKFDYTLIPDAKSTCEEYGIRAFPTNIVIDKKGIVKYIANSDPKIETLLQQEINKLLP